MPAQKKRGVWLLPAAPDEVYRHHGGFRFITRGEDGGQIPGKTYPTEAEARDAKREAQRVIDGVSDMTVKEARQGYELYLRDDGWDAESIKTAMIQLCTFLAGLDDELLERFDKRRCQTLYNEFRGRPQVRSLGRCRAGWRSGQEAWEANHERGGAGCLCKPYSVTSQLNYLGVTRMFWAWAVRREYVKGNPFLLVETVGERKHGKKQLGVKQSQLFLQVAHPRALAGEEGAIAAMFALLMGLRASLIINLRVDMLVDEDEDGDLALTITDEHLLTIPGIKSEASVQVRKLHPDLVPYVKALIAARGETNWTALLWSTPHDRGWPCDWAQRLCDEAGVPVVTAHGLRGTYISTGRNRHEEAEQARQMGHTSYDGMTAKAYDQPAARAKRSQTRAWKLLSGGKKAAG